MRDRKQNKRIAETPPRRKMSEMIWEFAGDFIRLGTTRGQRQIRLTAASCAWNIASTPPERRRKMLDGYMAEYHRFNPNIDPADSAAIRSDMQTLIERKLKLFPMDLRQIVGARLVPVGDKERIDAASATIG